MSTIPGSRIYKGWLKEFFWFLLVLLQAPIGLFYRESQHEPRDDAKRTQTIVLLTGALCSPLLYRRLAKRLTARGFAVRVFSTATIFTGLREHASRLSSYLDENNIEAGILIGHGLGSLVALNLADAARQRVDHLISLGTPFHGTRLLLPLRFVPALRDMAVGSDYLLLNRMNALLFPSFDPFSAYQDQWIVPFNLAHFGQGRDLILDQVGHYNIALGGDNADTIAEIVAERHPAPATAVAAAHLALDRPDDHMQPAKRGETTKRNQSASANRSKKKAAGKKKQTATKPRSKKKAVARGRKR